MCVQSYGSFTIQDMNNNILWASSIVKSASKIGRYYLIIQDDSNLVIYDANNAVYWATFGAKSSTAKYITNYWPMSNLIDIVGGANLFGGTSYSFVSDRFDSPNSAIYFNLGYLQVPEGVYFSGDFTFTSWIYLKSIQSWARLFDFGNGNPMDNIALSLYEQTCQIFGQTNKGTSVSDILTPSINLNQWYFVSFVLSGTTGYIYFDGNQIANGTLFVPNNLNRKYNYFGKSNWAENSNADAIYDEIKIYKGALSKDEINYIYTYSSSVTTTTTTTSTA